MKTYALLLLSVLVIVSACTSTSETASTESESEIQSFADSLFQSNLDSAHFAGSSLMVVQGGKTLINKKYGLANMELNVPMPENAVFEIGSVTKQFTAAAILRLMEEGKLKLDDDFTEYMDFDTKGREITIAQLMDHTSGIPSYTEMEEFWTLSMHEFERDSLVRLVETKEFLFEPGEAMIYNNSAYFFLGLIIEKVSEMSYEDYLAQEFFEPLGMENTYYCSNSRIISGKTSGYVFNGEGLMKKPYLDHTWPYAAGSLCSSTEDLLLWLEALHSGKVFGEDSYQLLTQPAQLNDGTPIRYGMGLATYVDKGHQRISHGGGIHGFISGTRYYPEDDLYVICLVNSAGPNGPGYLSDQITWKLLEKSEATGIEVKDDHSPIAGRYQGNIRGSNLVIDVTAINQALIFSEPGAEDEADTVTTYLGDYTWADDDQKIIFKNGELHIDDIYGYYVLTRD